MDKRIALHDATYDEHNTSEAIPIPFICFRFNLSINFFQDQPEFICFKFAIFLMAFVTSQR